jgi:ribosome-binding factor A
MANPGYPRAHRLAETIKRTLGEWLERQPADRRLGFVTITDVRVTGDLRQAKVYVTVLDPGLAADVPSTPEAKATFQTLVEATPEARTWIARHVRLRYAPTLEFVDDDVAREAARIDQLLAGLDQGQPESESLGERHARDPHP